MTEYALGRVAAVRRARALVAVGAASGLAPLVLALELLGRVARRLPPSFWVVAVAVVALVVVRAITQYREAKRKLLSLAVVVDDDAITTHTVRETRVIPRSEVARIVEIEGALGGIRVESIPDARSGAARVISVPRGGEGFAPLRARLEGWRSIGRRGRRGPLARWVMAAAVVAAIFFLPFVLEDLVARSPIAAGVLVALTWFAMRRIVAGT